MNDHPAGRPQLQCSPDSGDQRLTTRAAFPETPRALLKLDEKWLANHTAEPANPNAHAAALAPEIMAPRRHSCFASSAIRRAIRNLADAYSGLVAESLHRVSDKCFRQIATQ